MLRLAILWAPIASAQAPTISGIDAQGVARFSPSANRRQNAPSLVDSARFEVYRIGRDAAAFLNTLQPSRRTLIVRIGHAAGLVRRLPRTGLVVDSAAYTRLLGDLSVASRSIADTMIHPAGTRDDMLDKGLPLLVFLRLVVGKFETAVGGEVLGSSDGTCAFGTNDWVLDEDKVWTAGAGAPPKVGLIEATGLLCWRLAPSTGLAAYSRLSGTRSPDLPPSRPIDLSGTWLLSVSGRGLSSGFSPVMVRCSVPGMLLVLAPDGRAFSGAFNGGSGTCEAGYREPYDLAPGTARATVDDHGAIAIQIADELVLVGIVQGNSMSGTTTLVLGATRISGRWNAVRPRQ
jgi:hypothetical protein